MRSKKKSDLEKQIEALPNVKKGMPVKWTLDQNAMILKYYETKGGTAIAGLLGMSYKTIRKQFLLLKEAIKR